MRAMTASKIGMLCDISPYLFADMVASGVLAAPDVVLGALSGYSSDKSREVVRTIKEEYGVLQRVSRVAERSGVPFAFVQRLIKSGVIPGPSVKLKLSFFYKEREADDVVQRVQERWKKIRATAGPFHRIRHEKRRKDGFLSKSDVARLGGVKTVVVLRHIAERDIPRPRVRLATFCGRYYTKKQGEKVIAFLKKNAGGEECTPSSSR